MNVEDFEFGVERIETDDGKDYIIVDSNIAENSLMVPFEKIRVVSDMMGGMYSKILNDLQDNCEHEQWIREEGTQILERRFRDKDGRGQEFWTFGQKKAPQIKPFVFFVWEERCPNCYLIDTIDCYVVTWEGVLKEGVDEDETVDVEDFEYVELIYIDSKREQKIHAQYDIIDGDRGFSYLELREEFSREDLDTDEDGNLIYEVDK